MKKAAPMLPGGVVAASTSSTCNGDRIASLKASLRDIAALREVPSKLSGASWSPRRSVSIRLARNGHEALSNIVESWTHHGKQRKWHSVSKNAPPVTFGHFAITNAEEAYGIDYGDFHGLDKKTHKLQKVDWFSPLSLYIHHWSRPWTMQEAKPWAIEFGEACPWAQGPDSKDRMRSSL